MTTVVLRGISKLSLQLSEMVEDIPRTGIMIARRRGVPVVLHEGRNEVDDQFWRSWADQNKGSGLLSYIYEET